MNLLIFIQLTVNRINNGMSNPVSCSKREFTQRPWKNMELAKQLCRLEET
eukprot:m.5293 g.5293  ORF g.5293 m.5293 type:complete len:50 (-) comp4185_c0_seq1:268-417(-)